MPQSMPRPLLAQPGRGNVRAQLRAGRFAARRQRPLRRSAAPIERMNE